MTLAEVDAVAAKLRGDAVAPTDAGTADGTRESTPPANAERKQRTGKNARRDKLKAAVRALNVVGTDNTPWGDYGHLIEADIPNLSNDKLKRHLEARGEQTEGSKAELIRRLRNSVEGERETKIAIELQLEAKHREIADLEERGAVYVAGKNAAGQLGGDDINRPAFVVIPQTRGKYVQHIAVGGNFALATTASHEVFSWGLLGLNSEKASYKSPRMIDKLNGEEIVKTAVGANHACAVSSGGDLFVWGLTNNVMTHEPRYIDTIAVASIECGEMHTCALTKNKGVCAWGYGAHGRLGREFSKDDQWIPLPANLPPVNVVNLIACGSEHTLLSTLSATFSFGCGDGGRLGHGDFSDRPYPCEIAALRGSHALSISAGTWHSACVLHVAPLIDSGWLYTWGSGFVGQLALGKVCRASTPALVLDFCDEGLSVKQIICGSRHNAAITNHGHLYTWGSQTALGRKIDLPFTPHPGIVAEFGKIVDRIGRGLPMSVACGREYTIVATHPYNGPTEAEAIRLADERKIIVEEENKRLELLIKMEDDDMKRREEIEAERTKIKYLTSKRLCSMDCTCPGFTYDAHLPSICRDCGFSVVYHTIVVEERDDA